MKTCWSLILVVAAAWGYGCGTHEHCDPDQDLRNRVCFARDNGDGAAADVPPPLTCEGGLANFGETCEGDQQCGCGADTCAKLPTDKTGFCSRSDCLKDPSVCPKGWTCTDLSAYQPGFSMCLRQ